MTSVVRKIACVCLGNGDRSPFMAALLAKMLLDQGRVDFIIESAGVLDSAKSGGTAPQLSIEAAPTYGIDLSEHRKKHVENLQIDNFDLIVVADKRVQEDLVNRGVKAEIICLELEGANNAWMSQNRRKVDDMIVAIISALYREVIQYKFRI